MQHQSSCKIIQNRTILSTCLTYMYMHNNMQNHRVERMSMYILNLLYFSN